MIKNSNAPSVWTNKHFTQFGYKLCSSQCRKKWCIKVTVYLCHNACFCFFYNQLVCFCFIIVLFKDEEHSEKILQAEKPGQMKSFGRKVRNFDEKIWLENREKIVKKGNIAKVRNVLFCFWKHFGILLSSISAMPLAVG